MNIGVVGATGLVGRTIVRILEERNIGIHTLSLFASPRSVGEKITFLGEEYVVSPLTEESFKGLDVALFSAGGAVSREYAPIAAAAGCIAIDNSSTWRMDVGVPLVVPEVNPDDVKLHKGIIANPNCSTIQMVVALKPLHDVFGLKRIVVSTYQSPSGAGHKGVAQLESEIEGHVPELRISSHSIAYNTVFHKVGGINESSEEEIKMMNETRRIMHLPELPIAVTCVRVPVLGGHGESVAIETLHTVAPDNAREVLSSSAGIVVVDDPASDGYPTPLSASGTDLVYVGRIRNDSSVEHGLLLWVVADNLRKGAATNAVQILELLQ
ncbi:MAG: aspartate-semialdehyde dehydrogenase [Ignavibacteria bacterium]|nr:aspartate-semialdehyde dehydrogenase [Ignavibacteria bacterium]